MLQPFLTMVVFSVFFGRLAGLPSDGLPYPLFTYAALLPWQLFAYALTESSNSLVRDQRLIVKVYFPRLAVPFAAALSGLVDFAIAFVVLLGMMFYYGTPLTVRILFPAPFHPAGAGLGAGGWAVVGGAECAVPRCALCHPLYRPAWFFPDPHRLFQQPGACRLRGRFTP